MYSVTPQLCQSNVRHETESVLIPSASSGYGLVVVVDHVTVSACFVKFAIFMYSPIYVFRPKILLSTCACTVDYNRLHSKNAHAHR